MEVGNEQLAIDRVHAAVRRAVADGRETLLLLPGGSAAQLVGPLLARLDQYQDRLTVTLTDERYGLVGHPDSNWPLVSAMRSTLPRAQFVPVLDGTTLAETTAAFTAFLADKVASGSAIIALLGIGSDGHTAGIKPHSPALVTTEFAAGYQGEDFQRVTISAALFPYLEDAVIYAAGPEKAAVIERLAEDVPLDAMPAQLIKRAHRYHVIYSRGNTAMQIGFVGLGKMGNQIVAKLLKDGHAVTVFDVSQTAVDACAALGATAATSREELVARLGPEPKVWLMIPADFVEAEVQAYLALLPGGSTLIDGGNSNFHDTQRRAAAAETKGIRYIDVGTSGGILGLAKGFCLMVGGPEEHARSLAPIFDTMVAPAGAWAYVGSSGSGHYVKMVHNGIEYSLMQSYAEGYDLLKYGEMRDLNLAAIATVWQGGSIIESQLNGLIADVLHDNPELDGIEGYVADSGEGRWTYEVAQAADVAMPALREAIAVRTASQHGYHIFATKLLAGLRNKFGGHAINNAKENQ